MAQEKAESIKGTELDMNKLDKVSGGRFDKCSESSGCPECGSRDIESVINIWSCRKCGYTWK